MSVGARLIADVCALADKPFVETVENTFAGYFDELGILVKLRPEATDAEVVALQNELLNLISIHDLPAGFTWMVKFSRGGRNLRALFPGDAPRTSGEDLEWTE